jgi:hypothetical protein
LLTTVPILSRTNPLPSPIHPFQYILPTYVRISHGICTPCSSHHAILTACMHTSLLRRCRLQLYVHTSLRLERSPAKKHDTSGSFTAARYLVLL